MAEVTYEDAADEAHGTLVTALKRFDEMADEVEALGEDPVSALHDIVNALWEGLSGDLERLRMVSDELTQVIDEHDPAVAEAEKSFAQDA